MVFPAHFLFSSLSVHPIWSTWRLRSVTLKKTKVTTQEDTENWRYYTVASEDKCSILIHKINSVHLSPSTARTVPAPTCYFRTSLINRKYKTDIDLWWKHHLKNKRATGEKKKQDVCIFSLRMWSIHEKHISCWWHYNCIVAIFYCKQASSTNFSCLGENR